MRLYTWFVVLSFLFISTVQAEVDNSDSEMLCHIEVEGYHPAIAPPPSKPILFVAENGYLVIKVHDCPRGILLGRQIDGKPICGNKWLGTKL